ncbi:MAG: 3-dehydro-L-gulonate 2-dehydrogenase [Chitinophagaceae bacterium]|nr:MAG: 3-dehydro-L-gulonate 2-dehydrogenase [Chitinophagaceae bacterium]
MRIFFDEMKDIFTDILVRCHFSPEKTERCATIFASNSLDGVYSHGINRFPVFIDYVKQGLIHVDAEPELIQQNGSIETWDGHSGPGMYNASKAMERAIVLSKSNGIGCVAIRNTNHWMRGGTYGWQAADAGCIGICFTNTIANMPPWGGKEPRLGNNPLIISIPRAGGHLVLDMAMSQFSYGKLQEYELKARKLPVVGGYDNAGELTDDPSAIVDSRRALPIGFWKGSGLSFILDVVLTALTGGQSVSRISSSGHETGVSQAFICIYQPSYPSDLIEEIIAYTKSGSSVDASRPVLYPGENTLATRRENEMHGIPVDEKIWESIRNML